MALYHCTIKHGKVHNAQAHCEYITREGRYAHGEMKEELMHKECSKLPNWAPNVNKFFDYADGFERSNGNAYTEFEVALPVEFSLDENTKLVHQLIDEHIGTNKVWCFAIHEKMATLDPTQRQPHAHIMFSERIITDWTKVKYVDKFFSRFNRNNPENGGYQKDNRFTINRHESSKIIYQIRKSWENIVNTAYKKNGFDIRVSCETLQVQRQQALERGDYLLAEELDRPPQNHLGPKLAGQMKRLLAKSDFTIEMLPPKAQVAYLAREMKKVNQKIREQKEYISSKQPQKQLLDELLNETDKVSTDKTITITGRNLATQITVACNIVKKILEENKEKIAELNKKIKSDDGIESLALSIYTKGATKKLKKEAQYITSLKAIYESENTIFLSGKLNPNSDEYHSTTTRLEQLKSEIAQLEFDLANKQNFLTETLAQEKHQNALNQIRNILFEERAAQKDFIRALQVENTNFVNIAQKLLKARKQLSPKIKYSLENFNIDDIKKEKSIFELKKLLSSIRKSVAVNERMPKNKMQFNFHRESNDIENDDLSI